MCRKLNLNGLILVGATDAMTDAAYLSQYFVEQKVDTSVILVPCTVDGNIFHNYISTSIGFDTASKVYS